MTARLNAMETRVSLDHFVKQIGELEKSILAVQRDGMGPLIFRGVCNASVRYLGLARGGIETLICRYDS